MTVHELVLLRFYSNCSSELIKYVHLCVCVCMRVCFLIKTKHRGAV